MIGEHILKVPKGKLIRTKVEYESQTIISVHVTGDFFLHPEDTIHRLEEGLRGAQSKEVAQRVQQALEGARLYGADVSSITDAVLGAMESAK